MLNYLKKFVFLLIIPFFFACNSDDDEAAIDGANIVGTWTFESSEIELTINGEDGIAYFKNLGFTDEQAAEFEAAFAGQFEDQNLTITFNADKSVTGSSDGEAFSGTWSLNSDATVLTIVEEGDSQAFDIFELSSTKLSFGIDETIVDDIDGDDVDDTMVVKIVINLKK